MKLLFFAIALLTLAGCAQENVKQALDQLSKDCDRHYTFSISTGSVGLGSSVAGTMTADCKHEFNGSAPPGAAPAAPVTTVPAPAPAPAVPQPLPPPGQLPPPATKPGSP